MDSNRRRCVLIFAHECEPYNRAESTIGAQRPAQFAKWLPEYGWRAIVICCDARRRRETPRSALADVRRAVAQRMAESDPLLSVVVPTPSLTSDGMIDALAQSLGWGRLSGKPGAALARKPLTALKLFTGDYSQSWQPCAYAAAEEIRKVNRIDVCMSEHSPDAGLYLARRFSRKFGVPWVADFRDPPLSRLSRVARVVHRPWLRRLMRGAEVTINVNPVLAQLAREELGRPAACIPNGYDPDEFVSLPSRAPNRRQLRIAYIGNVNAAFQRMELFLDGLRILKSASEDGRPEVAFTYVGAAAQTVQALAAERGVGELVQPLARMERQKALALASEADVLLVLGAVVTEPGQWNSQGVVPGKVFEYFGLRKPILCVPSDRGLLAGLLQETRTGTACDTPAEVAAYLTSGLLALQSGKGLEYSPHGPAVRRYTRRVQAGMLARILDACVDGERALGERP